MQAVGPGGGADCLLAKNSAAEWGGAAQFLFCCRYSWGVMPVALKNTR